MTDTCTQPSLTKSFLTAVITMLLGILGSGAHASNPPTEDWRETFAYTQGMQAFTFGFPWVMLSDIRWRWVARIEDGKAPLNQFWHASELTTAEYRDGGSPNNDTFYSIAWLDLTKEPVILTVPDVGDRYYTFELASMDSDNFAYVGSRTTGTKRGSYAIVGPDWHGELPEGVTALPASRTPFALMIGRTLVYGPEDVTNVEAIQEQYTLVPLSLWGTQQQVANNRNVWKPYDKQSDPLAVWKTMNRAMTENPPHAKHLSIVNSFARINVGPNQDVTAAHPATKRGLARAAKDGMKLLQTARNAGLGKKVNGWTYPPTNMGRAGLQEDFIVRAASQALAGIIANDPEEGVYISTALDSQGNRLSGEHSYVMRFAPGQLPDVDAFWSLSLYGMDNNFVANPIGRYKLGTYPKGQLTFAADGSLTLYLQHAQPADDKLSNWLPTPKDEFRLILRTYMPGEKIIRQEWEPPALIKNPKSL